MKSFIASLLFVASMCQAQTVDMIVPFPPGGPTDMFARQLQQELTKDIGINIVVANRPGGDGKIASQEFLNQNTGNNKILIVATGTSLFSKLNQPNSGFDPINDLEIVGPIATSSTVIAVTPGSKIQTLNDLIAVGRKENINCGTSNAMATFFIKSLAAKEKLNINVIPFKGSADVSNNLLGKHIDCAVDAYPQVQEFVKTNMIKIVALSTNDRFSSAPVVDLGSYKFYNFYAIALPQNMDPTLRQKILGTVLSLHSSPDFTKALNERGFHVPKASVKFSQTLQADYLVLDKIKAKLN